MLKHTFDFGKKATDVECITLKDLALRLLEPYADTSEEITAIEILNLKPEYGFTLLIVTETKEHTLSDDVIYIKPLDCEDHLDCPDMVVFPFTLEMKETFPLIFNLPDGRYENQSNW